MRIAVNYPQPGDKPEGAVGHIYDFEQKDGKKIYTYLKEEEDGRGRLRLVVDYEKLDKKKIDGQTGWIYKE